MSNVKQFNNFQTSYRRLVEKASNDLTKIFIEFYHHDFQSEPFLHVEAPVERIFMEHVEEHGNIILILTSETTFTFNEKNYNTNISNDVVVFSSKNDEQTYCIIEFI
ncbi:hypothetical protein [Virgibacillus salexigens]|uniref:hypothetical protein n=1 Tax=Virgibacillus salexigens TaxID=61016 RepID=UPI00190E027E|nr:hypothetical protein [Virgibacillus salexigens]